MVLSRRSLAIASGLLWGGAILVVGVVQFCVPRYGSGCLHVVSSVYPGYRSSGGLGDQSIGTLIGVLDGAAGGFLFGWLDNATSRRRDET